MSAEVDGRKNLLVKGLAGRAWVAAGLVAGCALAGGAPLFALPHGAVASAPGISVVAEGRSERWIVDLGGVLVAALSPESATGGDGLWLLVRPPRKPDGPRRLLRLRLEPEPRLELVGEGLDGGFDALAAVDLGGENGLELVAGGLDRIVALGPVAALGAGKGGAEGGPAPVLARPLLEAPGLDLQAFAPGRLHRGVESGFAAVEPGRMKVWRPAGTGPDGTMKDGESPGTLRLEREAALPLVVTRTATGLRLASPAVAALASEAGEIYLAGPEAVGSTRLRAMRIDGAAAASAPEELWAALPGPEKVNQSWPFELDGVPVLVVRTQASDEVNLFERQRLRVLTLSADRTRSGAPPTLAVELDSKRWHETAIALGDVDGDGHDDLLAAFPEGLSGTDLVAQWWHGEGGGRFDSRAHRSDLKKAPSGWALVATPDLPGGTGLFLVGNGRMELRAFSPAGKSALAERPGLAVSIPALPVPVTPKADKKVTISVGGDGESSKVENIDPEAEPLGAVELDGRPGAELLAVQGSGNGNERLILLRSRPE